MDKAKVKNFIILLLVLVNLFLLAIVLTNVRQARLAAADRKQALIAVLSQNGIRLSEDVDLSQSIPPQFTLRRDAEREQALVSNLIGTAEMNDLGGNVYSYKSDVGEAKFRGTGEFTVLFSGSGIDSGKDAAATVHELLKKLGLRASDEAVQTSGSEVTVTLCCAWDDHPVYNARMAFYFSSDRLRLITGTRLFDKQSASAALEDCPDSVTVLMNFLQSVRSTGDVCTEIRGLDIGYFLVSSVSGECSLRPVWCVRTDSRAYYIDAETGKSESLETAA
ncbi:MAG: hypothetical protein ACOX66_06405 [Oscillospiraceae bacterium]|jgi:hypothetical protein